VRKVLLTEIIIDPEVQIRDSLNQDKVEEYAQVIDQLPPVALFADAGGRLYLGDGFHRVEAARLAGWESITANISPGGREAALEHAARAR
jgi:ParB-like chromosome segregation protein Spo0J